MDGTNVDIESGLEKSMLETVNWQNPYLNEETVTLVARSKAVHGSHPSTANYFYAETQEITAALGIGFNPENPIPARNALVEELGSYDVMFSDMPQEDGTATPIMYASIEALHNIGVRPEGSEDHLPAPSVESTYEI